ncbi:glucose PTS transporter subunit IIA [Mycoplasma crocodyli]|uniref:PTS system, glucose/glucosamine/beta-glucoside-specific, IICBA component n=1 Tax=Mycoplasma crocodyli (strain ATCC 51981 / MP145) TaxID=512564 RepID=D5E545_MYCCM|nr:glucose PTS transporter subunit IIA [Mycoplasma crocodyli]ADE19791.1 PTS system, glucose/glucosamine/beta-glucoside-specific, IICBA component [Mycoplasma crocodyli MP145]
MGFFSKLFNKQKTETCSIVIKQETRDIVEALGGINNITGFNNGAIRLRYDVKDSSLVNANKLKELGASEVLILGLKYVEVKFGEISEQINLDIRCAASSLKEEEAKNVKVTKGNLAPAQVVQCEQATVSKTEKKVEESVELVVPTKGKIEGLATLQDGVFSEKMLGDGFVINISDQSVAEIVSPVSGKLAVVFPSKHAYGIQCESGLELLIHIGIDTVKLGGLGFTSYVKLNDNVKKGDKLVSVDVKKIISEGLNPNVIVVITPDSKLQNIKQKDDQTFLISK